MRHIRTRLLFALATVFSILQTYGPAADVKAQQKSPLQAENPILAVVAGRKEIRARDVEALFPSEMRSLRERFDALKKAGS